MSNNVDMTGGDRRAVASVVQRPRLNAMLDAQWPRLCVVRAASGSGKTTLLRSWTVDRADPAPLLWMTISSEVASPAAFWTRVTDAARRTGVVSANTSASLAEQVAMSDDPVTVAIDFLKSAEPGVFVFDAYEKVGEAIADIDRDLLLLTEALPQIRVVVAARGYTGLAADALRLRDRVRVIDDEDLAFTQDETAALLRVHLGRDDPALAASIVRATRGYALGMRAMVLAMSRQGSIPAVDSQEWRQLVATDLRSTLPDESTAQFVAATSVPPYFDAALAAMITGRSNVNEVLSVLERQGFGRWIPYSRQNPVFQYVESVRETFAAELRRTSTASYRRSGDLASRWLFSKGDHELAFDLALASQSYPLAVQVYLDLLRENPECYITDRLLGPLSSLPVSVLREHPMLAFALGLARLTHPVLRAAAPEAFQLSVNNPSRTEIVSPDLDGFVNKGMRAVSLRLIGRYTDAARSSRVAIAEIDGLSPERLDEFSELIAMILRQLSYNLFQGGAYSAAIATMNRSAALTKHSSTRNFALAFATGSQAFIGDLPATRAARASIDPGGWPRNSESSYLNAMTHIGEGFMQLDKLNFATALDTVTGSAAFTATTEFWGLFTLVWVHAQLGLGNGLAAARLVEERLQGVVLPHGIGNNTGTRALRNVHAIAWLASGRIAKAERILAAVSPRATEVVPARALHLILTDRSPAAVERLSRWLALPGHTIRSRAATLTLGAVAARRVGDDRLAVTLAARGHDLHGSHGVRAHLMYLPAADRLGLAELADRAGDHGTATYLREVEVDAVPAAVPQIILSNKELDVLAELAGTSSREEIATRLGVSLNTIKSQVHSIYRKLGVSSWTAAMSAATEYELLERRADKDEVKR